LYVSVIQVSCSNSTFLLHIVVVGTGIEVVVVVGTGVEVVVGSGVELEDIDIVSSVIDVTSGPWLRVL